MTTSIDIADLREAATQALAGPTRRGVAAGWPTGGGRGSVYTGATFTLGRAPWVVVRGPQRPECAQLLDSTVGLMQIAGAAHALAILEPEEVRNHQDAPQSFRSRYQTATWSGLGVVAVETEGEGAWTWQPSAAPELTPMLNEIALRLKGEIDQRRHDEAWVGVVREGDSPAAERLVRPLLDAALGSDFARLLEKEWKFRALWRNGKTDGVWRRESGFPRTVALEVKVSEDVGAPFCQAFDDLGQFDAVLYVRLCGGRTRQETARLTGLAQVKEEVQRKVPIRFVEVDFS